MSNIYLGFLLSFLITICIIITSELQKILDRETLLFKLTQKLQLNKINHNEIILLSKIYILKKLWFLSLTELEKQTKIHLSYKAEYYYLIGLCYFNIQLNHLAIKSYQKAINIKPQYTEALSNLGKIYELNKKHNSAQEIYKYILKYDINNENAKLRLNQIENRDSRI